MKIYCWGGMSVGETDRQRLPDGETRDGNQHFLSLDSLPLSLPLQPYHLQTKPPLHNQ